MIDHSWKFWTSSIAQRLSEQLGETVAPEELIVPPNTEFGDLAFGCFRLAKEQKKNPVEMARDIAAKFDNKYLDVAEAVAVGPYVNFKFAIGDAVKRVVTDIERGVLQVEHPGERGTVALEYAQPNTHKEIHVGHLRNQFIGSALVRILQAAGWQVIPLSYHGDIGAHVAKCLWWLIKSRDLSVENLDRSSVDRLLSEIPEEQRNGKYLGEIYSIATGKLDAAKESGDENAQREVSQVLRLLEAHDTAWEHLWRETRRWSLDEMALIFKELDVRIERQYLESVLVERGQSIVDELLARGIAKVSEGAVVVDLEDKGLGIFLIRKSDGTSLYATKDLALAELKFHEYPEAARSLVVVDTRQTLYFKQLFETLRRMGFKQTLEFVGHEFLTLKSGAMSSRQGNVVAYQTFRDAVLDHARGEILARHADWNEGKVTHTAWALAMAGMKFGILKQDNDKVFTFDLDQALSFDGATGPYCQYAAVRLASILKKAGRGGKEATEATVYRGDSNDSNELTREFDHLSEKALALVLAQLPIRIEQAARELRPSVIAQWCVEAAQCINDFYRDVPVLDSADELREGRLRLAAAARLALGHGLELLGIPLPDEM